MCSTGGAVPSNDLATRRPEPVITSASALPDAQPERSKICCSTGARFEVRWLTPCSRAAQPTGLHDADAAVRAAPDKLNFAVENGPALSVAKPLMARSVGSAHVSSALNCT